jgi:sulfatase modifying factor 1
MSRDHELSRREFLKMVGVTASAITLGACTPRTSTETKVAPKATTVPPRTFTETEVAPGATTVPPQTTPEQVEPTEEIKPNTPEMVLVEAGGFEMGSTDGFPDEQPVHRVEMTRSFHIGKYEVSFEEYDVFCEDTIGFNKPDDRGMGRGKRPVAGVDWNDAVAYCNWLSEKEGLTPCYSGKGKMTECDFSSNGYRLPTEAEWEYAARGGQKSQGYVYAGSDDPDIVAWYGDNSDDQSHPVGQKQPNEMGLYDMSGNSLEWCWDWYVEEYYASSPSSDPEGPPLPSTTNPWELVRVRRSGNWKESSDSVRTACRSYDDPTYPGGNGFRLAKTNGG